MVTIWKKVGWSQNCFIAGNILKSLEINSEFNWELAFRNINPSRPDWKLKRWSWWGWRWQEGSSYKECGDSRWWRGRGMKRGDGKLREGQGK